MKRFIDDQCNLPSAELRTYVVLVHHLLLQTWPRVATCTENRLVDLDEISEVSGVFWAILHSREQWWPEGFRRITGTT